MIIDEQIAVGMLNEPYPYAIKTKTIHRRMLICLYRGGEGNTICGGMFIPGGRRNTTYECIFIPGEGNTIYGGMVILGERRELDIGKHVYTGWEKGTQYLKACLYRGGGEKTLLTTTSPDDWKVKVCHCSSSASLHVQRREA